MLGFFELGTDELLGLHASVRFSSFGLQAFTDLIIITEKYAGTVGVFRCVCKGTGSFLFPLYLKTTVSGM